MQRRRHLGLDQRMLYDWARLYGEQLGKGTDYTELRPVVSVERIRAAELAELAELQEVKAERDAAVAASEAERAAKDAERAAKEAALAEIGRLAAENAALRARLGPTDR